MFGVYLHIPFCRHRCDYCAFATWTDRHHLADRYLAACRRQLEAISPPLPPVTSVFVGGGTPSQVGGDTLAGVLADIALAPGAEVTIEANPDDVTLALADTYRAAGATRISLGVQSMVPAVLAALGRRHQPAQVERAVAAVRAAGLHLNIDLIYGAAGETVDDWSETLDRVLGFGPHHVSAYALTVEPGTVLARDPARHPDDDDQADKYLMADERLTAAGFGWYEISNWARPERRCRHNLLYWQGGDYLGVGCAAHSHRDGRRWWNVRTPERYIASVEAGRSSEAGAERLPPDGRRIESLQLAIRTVDGVSAGALSGDDRSELGGLVEERAGRIVLTPTGRLLANEVAVRLG